MRIEKPQVFQFLPANPLDLLPILEDRLPRSANILNIALNTPNFPEETHFYTLTTVSAPEDLWILTTFEREDDGTETFISGPKEAQRLPSEVVDALEEVINWTKPYKHVIDREFSPDFFRLSLKRGNPVMVRPCNYFYLTREEAILKSMEVAKEAQNYNDLDLVTPLPLEAGSEFFCSTYKYSKARTEEVCRKFTERSLSAGVVTRDGEVVSGAVLKGSGFMGFVFTKEGHRGRGLAQVVIGGLCWEMAKRGMVPCSTVEESNHRSNAFHTKIQMIPSHSIDFILYSGPEQF